MHISLILICLVGLLIDIWFIKTEYAGKMAKATVLKGLASACFVMLGALCYAENRTVFGRLILIGLILGMVGDIFLNLRNQFSGAASQKVFAIGILAFLSGHFLYIAALITQNAATVLPALLTAGILSILAIPPLMKRITAPSRGLKLFGYVYLVIVIAMFSCSAVLLVLNGVQTLTVLLAVGGLLFVVSDFIMIYYSFGKKIKPLRAINLLSYYAAQLLIALCILYS